jgi:hypothetical protein
LLYHLCGGDIVAVAKILDRTGFMPIGQNVPDIAKHDSKSWFWCQVGRANVVVAGPRLFPGHDLGCILKRLLDYRARLSALKESKEVVQTQVNEMMMVELEVVKGDRQIVR